VLSEAQPVVTEMASREAMKAMRLVMAFMSISFG